MRRTASYNEELSQRLRSPRYAQEFISSLMEGEDGLSAEDALRQTIQIMGVKEFSGLTGVSPSNLVAFGEKIPQEIRVKILNNVWCTTCREMRGIGNVEGTVEGGDLILKGICTKCGGKVARLIESG